MWPIKRFFRWNCLLDGSRLVFPGIFFRKFDKNRKTFGGKIRKNGSKGQRKNAVFFYNGGLYTSIERFVKYLFRPILNILKYLFRPYFHLYNKISEKSVRGKHPKTTQV